MATPQARRTFFARGPVADTFCVIMTCYLYFNFFGVVGLENSYGEVCALLAILSVFVMFPLVTISCLYSTPSARLAHAYRPAEVDPSETAR